VSRPSFDPSFSGPGRHTIKFWRLIRDIECAIFKIGISEGIRGKADKNEVEKNFSLAREAYSRKLGTRYTSTPKSSTSKFTPENINLSLNETVIEKEKFSIINIIYIDIYIYIIYSNIDSLLISDSCDITIKPCADFKDSRIKDNLIMTQHNPFATLK